MTTDFTRPLAVGTYKASASFQSAPAHVAVMFADDCGLVAVTGYADDPENVEESADYARLFASAPEMLEKLEQAAEALSHAQGEWSSVDAAHAPLWTHELKTAERDILDLIARVISPSTEVRA